MPQAGLVPTDNITVYYKTSPEVSKVITDFQDYIFATIKQPVKPFPIPATENVLIQEVGKKDVSSCTYRAFLHIEL